jgi:hypothetical protein
MLDDPSKAVRSPGWTVAEDRRSDPRHAFSAAAEVVEDKSGTRIEAHVLDLGRQGCYLGTITPFPLHSMATVRITKGAESLEAKARVVSSTVGKGMGVFFTEIDQQQHHILAAWLAEALESSWHTLNRRQSQRISARLPVRASWKIGDGSQFEEETYTQKISAHGALILLSAPVSKGQPIILSNSPPRGSVECIVAHIGEAQGNLHEVGVRFVLPNQYQLIWNATSPPPERSKLHPDAKSAGKVETELSRVSTELGKSGL